MSWLKDYFSFSKRERNAFIGLVIIIVVFIFLPDFFSAGRSPATISDQVGKELVAVMDSQRNNSSPRRDQVWQTSSAPPPTKARLFAFDPNTLDEAGFIELGLTPKTARTIINYRNKGGRFRKPDDLRKIYSLDKTNADRIVPFARIAETYPTNHYRAEARSDNRSKPAVTTIDINTASVEEWKALSGIGDVLSARIVKFRERMGGFASIDQVAKTYGLKDSTFQLIRPYLTLATPAVNKININTAWESELMECDGVSKEIAQAIIIYRKQKGRFQTIDDLKKIVFINDAMFNRIAPCLKTD